jgi:hypothetical protein
MLRYGLVDALPPALVGEPEYQLEQRDGPAICSFWDCAASHIQTGTYFRPASESEHVSVRAALAGLNAADLEAHAALNNCIRHIVPLQGTPFGAKVHPWLFGCIFFHEYLLSAGPKETAVTLVHELAHHELFLINLVDSLVEPTAAGDPQPALGQHCPHSAIDGLHEAHALFRTTRYQRLAGGDWPGQAALLGEALTSLRSQKLTPLGVLLVDEVYQPQAG